MQSPSPAFPPSSPHQDFCADFAQNSLEPSNALSFLRQAVQYNCDAFRTSCVTLVATSFNTCCGKSTDGLPVEVRAGACARWLWARAQDTGGGTHTLPCFLACVAPVLRVAAVALVRNTYVAAPVQNTNLMRSSERHVAASVRIRYTHVAAPVRNPHVSRRAAPRPTQVIQEILDHPQLFVQTEEQVLLFVQNYVRRHQLDDATVRQLFRGVRLPFLSNDRLAALAAETPGHGPPMWVGGLRVRVRGCRTHVLACPTCPHAGHAVSGGHR